MTVVAKILQSKPDATVHTIAPTASVFDALKLMADKGIGALVVTEGDAIVGIFTERDYARKIALLGHAGARCDDHLGTLCAARADQRAVHADHEYRPPAPPARGGQQRQTRGHDLDRGLGQGHHLRAEIHH